MSKDDGGPAFPGTTDDICTGRSLHIYHTGMSMRDWFAGQALGEMWNHERAVGVDPETVARKCYNMADAMLKERER